MSLVSLMSIGQIWISYFTDLKSIAASNFSCSYSSWEPFFMSPTVARNFFRLCKTGKFCWSQFSPPWREMKFVLKPNTLIPLAEFIDTTLRKSKRGKCGSNGSTTVSWERWWHKSHLTTKSLDWRPLPKSYCGKKWVKMEGKGHKSMMFLWSFGKRNWTVLMVQ